MTLINCEKDLDLTWPKVCIVPEIKRTSNIPDNPNVNPPNPRLPPTQTTGAIIQLTSSKIYVPVVNLPIKGKIEFLENVKQGFKRFISWNKYRSKIATQSKNNNSDYLIDPRFRNINR